MAITRTSPRIYLTGQENLAELKTLGLVEKGQRWRARKKGWFAPTFRHPSYPQLDGPGGFQTLADPYSFVKAIIWREINNTRLLIDDDTSNDWTQEAITRCWARRHAAHVEHWSSYYYAMVRGLVRSWIVAYRRDYLRLIPLHKEK